MIQAWVDNSYCGDIAYASDARVKRDFTPLTGSLAKVQQFKPGTFYYRQLDPDVPSDGHLRLGLVAQDVQAVAPELVHDIQMVTALRPMARCFGSATWR